MTTNELVAAVDLGGTKTAAALVDVDGRLVARSTVPTPASEGPDAVLDAVADAVRALGGAPSAVGVGSAGVVDPVGGRVLAATDVLAGWAGTDLRDGVAQRLRLPVAVLNDVHAHGLGEALHGAGRGQRDVLVVAVGTGIGGAFVSSGQVATGAHAAAGHVGHVPSAPAAGLVCSCGRTGHLEAFASGPSLVRELQRRTGERLCDLRAVAARAERQDADALALLRDGGAAVGAVVGGLMNVLDPDVVVVGGGVTSVGAAWWDALIEACGDQVLPALAHVPVVRSVSDGDAALLGAASRAWEVNR